MPIACLPVKRRPIAKKQHISFCSDNPEVSSHRLVSEAEAYHETDG